MKQLYAILFVLICLVHKSFGQCDPNPQICNTNGCNIENVELTLVAEGNNVFCEEQEAILEIDRDQSLDFDFFIYYWCDGVVDTIGFNEPARHVYDIDDENICNASENLFFVTIIGVKECDGNITCRSIATSVTIQYKPFASFEAPNEVCITESLSLTSGLSCNGTSFLWDFGDGTTSDQENPSHTFATPGTYTVSLEVSNDCGTDRHIQTVNVVAAPEAIFSFEPNTPADLCNPVVVDFDDQTIVGNTTWSITPNDTLRWCFTDTTMNFGTDDISVLFKQPGEYEVTLTANNACPADEQTEIIEILEAPVVNLNTPPASCDEIALTSSDLIRNLSGSIDELNWTFEGGNPGSGTGEDFGTVTFSQSGMVTLRASSPCGIIERSVPVQVASTEAISLGNNPASLCQNDNPVVLEAMPAGNWSISGNSNALSGDTLNPALLSPDTYTLTYSAGTAECPNETTTTIEILPGVGVSLQEVEPECSSLALNTRDIVTYNGTINRFQWTASNGTSSAEQFPIINFVPGRFDVMIEVEGTCGIERDTVEIIVQADTEINITPVDIPLCSGSSPDTLEVNVEGGLWSGNGIIDENLGVFDPGEVQPDQTYTITYGFQDGACANSGTVQIEVVSSQTATIQTAIVCTDSDPIQLQVDATGGTWSGEGISEEGIFDPAGLTPDQNYPVRYSFTDPNGCAVETSAEILVEGLPVISKSDTIQLCQSDFELDLNTAFNYSVSPEGGNTTWDGPGVLDGSGRFNAVSLNVGFYSVRMDYQRNDCMVSDSVVVEIIEARPLSLSPDTTVCITSGTLQLSANLEGGIWSGLGIDGSGVIDLETTRGQGDRFDYNYAYLAGTSCEQNGTVTVEVINLEDVVSAGDDEFVCEGATTFSLSGGFPAGGTWSGPGITNPSTGTIDLTQLEVDVPNVYTYNIESELASACAAESQKEFIIRPNPTAAFEIEGLACINETFRLINNSTGATSYRWDFGDGSTSTEESPAHSYTNQNTYTLSLTSISEFGCETTVSRDLYITTPPIAAFDLTDNEGCAPFEVEVTNRSSGDEITQFWLIGQDTVFGDQLENVFLDSITQDSTFEIILSVQNLCGVRTDSKEVLVHPYPIVDFGISQDEGCSPSLVMFSNTTLGNPDVFSWDMGNGNRYSDSIPPDQIYMTSDTAISTYIISLQATNECGMGALSKEVTVFPPNVNAFIQQDTLRGCPPLAIELESFSTPGAALGWVIWDTDNQPREGSNVSVYRDTLLEPGLYTVVLTAANCGADTDTAFIEVLPVTPVEFILSRPFACVGDTISFINRSEDISRSEWDFGDGLFSTDRSPVHRFDSAGIYQVVLTGYSALNNCPNTYTMEVEVVDNPTAQFNPSGLNGCAPLTIDFTNQSEGNGNLRAVWDFGDGSSNSLEFNTAHTFATPGNYEVTLTVFDENNCFADTSVVNIFVYDAPQSVFTLNQSSYCLGYDTVYINNQSLDAIQFDWLIDGEAFSEESPIFFPTRSGEIPIQLITTNSFGCRDTVTSIINVLPAPQASFQTNTTEGCEDLTVRFENLSNFADRYIWQFEDGNSSTDFDPIHTYFNPGIFESTLVAFNDNGCPADTAIVSIQVNEKPVANFEFEKEDKCGTPNEVIFLNQSQGDLDHSWRFGDGNSSTLQNPIHLYQEPGVFPIQLIVKNEWECADTLTQEVDIFGQPIANFSLEDTVGCNPYELQINNLSAQSTSYIWNITGFPTITAEQPQVQLKEKGSYDIELIAIYNEFCQDTLLVPGAIQIYESPIADFFSLVNLDPNVLGEVQFVNRSVLADRYRWDFGDGNFSNDVAPYHVYDENRPLDVTLVAYNDNGGLYTCTDTIVNPVDPEWITTFYAPNAFAPVLETELVNVFKPVGIGLETYEIDVYAPWGKLVWRSTALENGNPIESWNGKYFNSGDDMPQGAYSWLAKIEFEDGNVRTFKGSVTLLR